MTAQAGTLRSNIQTRPAARGIQVLFRSIIAVLNSATCAVTFLFFFLFPQRANPLLLVFVFMCVVGIVSGKIARGLLKGRSGFLQFLVGLAGLIASMISINYFSGGVLGIGYLTIARMQVDIPAFIQVGIGFVTMLLTILAWRKPKAIPEAIEPSSPPRSYRSPEAALESMSSAPASVRLTPARRAINWISGHPVQPSNGRSAQLSIAPGRDAVSTQGSGLRLRRNTKIRERRSTLMLRGSHPVKFIGVEDHKCPYCLEPVVENDPRGVEICPICHTYHHADCWAVTGMCQVPHANG